jgi:hypothetical protein
MEDIIYSPGQFRVEMGDDDVGMAVSGHQPDIWGLTKGMLQSINVLLLKTIPFFVQQNVGLVQAPGSRKTSQKKVLRACSLSS